MPDYNLQLLVKTWPDGVPTTDNFELVEAPMPDPAPGEVLCRNIYLSIDPYYRHSLGPRFVGTPFCRPGDLMMGRTLSQVIKSRHPGVEEGEYVVHMGGMQTFSVANPMEEFQRLSRDIFGPQVPLSTGLGVMGIPGLTAYAAVIELGQPKPGDTFIVSSASGAVGTAAGQLAQLQGCRTIGIAGAQEKCDYAVNEIGFDACLSYKSDTLEEELKDAAPNGIDINMEHIGGRVLAAILPLMNRYSRVIISGLIDQYNKEVSPPGPNWGVIIQKRMTVYGLSVEDFRRKYPIFQERMARFIQSGRVKYKEDRFDGLEAAPEALNAVLTSRNFGKTIVVVGPEPV